MSCYYVLEDHGCVLVHKKVLRDRIWYILPFWQILNTFKLAPCTKLIVLVWRLTFTWSHKRIITRVFTQEVCQSVRNKVTVNICVWTITVKFDYLCVKNHCSLCSPINNIDSQLPGCVNGMTTKRSIAVLQYAVCQLDVFCERFPSLSPNFNDN